MASRRTPLFDWHSSHGGRIVEFGGWDMPVQYSGIVDEHHTVRKAVGLFDISHMGRLSFEGPQAAQFLSKLLTCRVDDLVDGQIRYSLVCNDEGGILDDVLVNRINASHYGLVVNASNREKIVNWIARCGNGDASNPGSFRLSTFELQFSDHTLETAMIAVQGPESVAVVNQFFNRNFSSMRYYTGQSVEIDGTSYFVSRTGYTGEDGFEIIVPATIAVSVWEKLLGIGSAKGIKPCGLGCRDTLRLEAAMPLYGHELTEAIDPLTAGLSFAVKLEKTDFHGHQALEQIKSKPDRPVRVGLKMATRRIPREHAEIYSGDQRIGEVTSGTFSPTLEQTIAMAYVDSLHSTIGSTVDVDIRGHREPAEVTALPFYRRAKKN